MNVGKIALILWVVTILGVGFFFVRGVTTESTDHRREIQLSPVERDMVLGEMRTILAAVNGSLIGLSANSMADVSKAASSAGMKMAVDGSPALMAKLPLEFKTMGMSLHEDFDQLAADIDSGFTKDQVITRLSEITGKCVSCHAAYRLSSEVSR